MKHVLAALCFLALLPRGGFGQACSSWTRFEIPGTVDSTQASAHGQMGSVCFDVHCGHGEIGFDVRSGRFSARAWTSGDMSSIGRVEVVDDFHIGGVTPGDSLDIEVVVHVSFYSGCHSFAYGRVKDQQGRFVSTTYDRCNYIQEELRLATRVVAGEPFRLTFLMSAYAYIGSASISGWLTFAGLPPAASIRSCKGYLYDAPVRTTPLSWSRLKNLYR